MSYAVKGAPFRYQGAVDVEDCKTSLEVLEKAGLNWDVDKADVYAKVPAFGTYVNLEESEDDNPLVNGEKFAKCSNARAVYRTDCGLPLGIVTDRYTPVQNRDAFTFFDDAIGKDKAIWQTAGYFGNGERIFVSAKLPDNILVNGDPVENYLVFTTSHNGSDSVKILFTPIRVVCQNTLNAAIKTADNYVGFRHTQSVHRKLSIASEILGICKSKVEYLGEQYTQLAKIPMTDQQAQETFANVVLTQDEEFRLKQGGHTIGQLVEKDYNAIENSGISMRKVNVLHDMYSYYFMGAGQRDILGTAWGVYNAVTGYYSNMDNSVGTKRMDSLLYGDKSRKIEHAGNLLLMAA